MKKSIVKRIGSLLTVLLLTASIFSNGLVAFAADTKHTQSKVLDWSYNFEGSGLKNAYDPLTGGNTNDAFRYKWAQEFYFWNDESGNNCYCVQLGTEHDNNTVMSSSTFDSDTIIKMYSNKDQRQNLKAATIYSYKGKTKYGYNADTERVASQAMIWTVSGGFFDSSSENLSSDENTILNRIYAPSSADHKNLVDCYKKMKGDILSHYKIPAGATTAVRTAPTYELKYNTSTKKYEGTIKADSSISQFDFSKVDGVTFKKDGSNIKVSANENIKAGTKAVTLTKARAKNSGKIEECVPLFYKGKNDSGSQAKVGYISGKDPVQAYFKLKIDMPTGNADLEKNFIDFFGNEETNVADKLKAVKFNLVMKNGDSDLFIKATGSDGKYTFSSTVSQANATNMTLDADGNIHVSGLPQGSYYWKETTTANGYALKTKTDVTVEADKTSKTVVDNQRTSVDKGELVIYKTDESGKKYLSGAKFEITAAEDIVVSGGITIRKKGDIIDTVTTDENGKAVITKDIYQGYSYTVTEIEAPKGYSLNSEPQTVKIATDTADFGSEVSVKNSPWTAPFIITKKNLGGELLPNCEFEILDENERQITTGITDENGIATFSLGYGKYFYHEIAAPEEYIIDDTLYPFEITEEGVSVYAEMTNSLKEGSIKVTKSTTGNLNVKDIGFIVKGISDTNSDIERELFTDENGEALFENLPIGKYTVTEDGSTVPYGYLVADSKQVTVAYAQTVDTDMVNEKVLDTKQADVYRHSLDSVVQFVVSQRCNLSGKIDLYADVDVSALDLIKNARDMILFSRAVQHAAKDTLFEIEKEVIAIDRKNEALDNAKTAKQESTSDRVDDILQDLIKLKFSQEQILALKQAVVAAAQNGEHNIQHWVSIRYSPDELQHISSLVADYYAQSVIEQTLDSKGILNDYYTYVNELNGRLKLSDMFSHHDYSDEQKAMLQQGFSEGISITVLNEVDERLTVDEIKTFFEMFHQAVDGQIDPHDVQIYLDKAVIEHSKQNVQAVEVQDNSADTMT